MVAQIDARYLRTGPRRVWSRLVSYLMFEGRPLTTRGQWINPILRAEFGLIRLLPQARRVEAPLFILGTGRSGTTILGIVLSVHRSVGFLNEPKLLWHTVHGGEDLIGSYSRGPARYRLGHDAATPLRATALQRVYGAYLRLSGTRRVVDKYPELIFRVPYVKALFPDARFLFLSRNGTETCGSIDRWSAQLGKSIGGEIHDWWGVNGRKWQLLVDQIIPEHADLAPHREAILALDDQRARAAVEWIVTMREGLSLLDAAPADVLHVPYAALCRAPQKTLAGIAAFAGLDPDPKFEQYGTDVLSPPPATPAFDLPDYLQQPFMDTQARLDASETPA